MALALFFLFLLTAFTFSFRFFQLEECPRITAPILWLAKIAFGFALWGVYTFYYTDRLNSDVYKYFDDAAFIQQAFHENKTAWFDLMTGCESAETQVYTSQMRNWERNFNRAVPFNENRLMIRLNAVLLLVSRGNIYLHIIAFTFLSFIGIIWLLKAFQPLLEPGKKRWALLTVLFPSFLFWTSGGLKEGLLLFSLGMLLFNFFRERKTLGGWLLLIAGFLLLLMLRYYFLLCLITPSLAFAAVKRNRKLTVDNLQFTGFYKSLLTFVSLNLAALLILVLASIADRKLDFPRVMAKKQKHAVAEALHMKAGSYNAVPVLDSTFSSVLRNMPEGLANTFTKPHPLQSRNPVMVLSALENCTVLLAVIFVFIVFTRNRKMANRYPLSWPHLLFFLNVIILYGALIGLVTPVAGNLVRYKVLLLPMIGMALLQVYQRSVLTTD